MRYMTLFLLLVTLLPACRKIDKFTQKTILLDEQVVLPSALIINLPFDIPTPAITTNIDEELSVDNSRKHLIEEAQLLSLKLTIIDPTDKTFKWLNDADIYINASGLEESKIAFIHDIPTDIGNEIVPMIIANHNIAEYIKKDEFVLHLKVVTDQINLEEVTIKIAAAVFIDAKILGL